MYAMLLIRAPMISMLDTLHRPEGFDRRTLDVETRYVLRELKPEILKFAKG